MDLTLILIIAGVVVVAGIVIFIVSRSRGSDISYTEDEKAILKAGQFDQFEVKRLRKRSLISTMYQAVDKITKKNVALRILHPSNDPDQVKGFLRRGEVLEFLNKQHGELPIVRLIKFGQTPVGRQNRAFIAVEYFDGMDLSELLEQRKALTVSEATSIIQQTARTLTVALREKVWHHQMAFQALMVRLPQSSPPEVILVDFDLYKHEGASSGTLDSRVIFMSPEQFENKIVDARSDVYSLGVMYYTLMTGRPPFVAEDYAEMARMHSGTPPDPMPPTVPEQVRSLVMKMLAKHPADRFRTMDDAVRAIDSLTPDDSWHKQPDTSGVKSIIATTHMQVRPSGQRRDRTRTPETRSQPSSVGKVGGKVGGKVMMEMRMIYTSRVGGLLSKLRFKSFESLLVFAVMAVILFALGGGLYYVYTHFIRTPTVSGSISIVVRDNQGKPLGDAEIAIEPEGGRPAEFEDLVTEQKQKGRFSTKSSRAGEAKAKYSTSPDTRMLVSVKAQGYTPNPRVDTLVVRGDTTAVLAFQLNKQEEKKEEGPKILSVLVRDNAKNPVSPVTVILTGKSGKEYRCEIDARGKGTIPYDLRNDGTNPRISLAAESLNPNYGQTPPKEGAAIQGNQLELNINDFFPYDRTVQDLMTQATYFMREKEWKKAVQQLQRVVQLKPGVGSAEGYALMAKAWFEEDKDNYNEVLKAVDKAMLDKKNVSGPRGEETVEMMHYYQVKALYEALDNMKSSDPRVVSFKRSLQKACNEYTDLFKRDRFNHLGEVKKIQSKSH